MNKIKIIDLLNMISKGEEVPEKIRYLSYEYTYNRVEEEYQRYQNELRYGLGEDRRLDIILDDEVEILEKPKEIPRQLNIRYKNNDIIINEKILQEDINTELADKINEILDYLESKGE